uniref:breast cancer metastasis-suppressor 1-like protein n=1 Tax=Myxine glutinosa TaxID=7769 RepID=UPI00358E8ED9
MQFEDCYRLIEVKTQRWIKKKEVRKWRRKRRGSVNNSMPGQPQHLDKTDGESALNNNNNNNNNSSSSSNSSGNSNNNSCGVVVSSANSSNNDHLNNISSGGEGGGGSSNNNAPNNVEGEMDQESPGNEESSDEETGSTSASEEDDEEEEEEEEEESSDMNDEDYERRRTECLSEMSDLEKQFSDLKEQLYRERISQVDAKLEEVRAGKALEYLDPLAALQRNMQTHIEVAGVYRGLCLTLVKHNRDCEVQGATQHLESEKLLLCDTMRNELEDKIRRLEEDRQNLDFSSELWNDEIRSKKKKKFDPFNMEKKKKPVNVTGPYIIYMLRDSEIMEDWTLIKKAGKPVNPSRRKSDLPSKQDKHLYSACFEEGKLFYEGDWYGRGHGILIDTKDDPPIYATITAINSLEVWIKRSDGSKSKLYISQLQKGKYAIRHA